MNTINDIINDREECPLCKNKFDDMKPHLSCNKCKYLIIMENEFKVKSVIFFFSDKDPRSVYNELDLFVGFNLFSTFDFIVMYNEGVIFYSNGFEKQLSHNIISLDKLKYIYDNIEQYKTLI
jgi:hypothetical protein